MLLKIGSIDSSVAFIKHALSQQGFWEGDQSNVFTTELSSAVASFQQTHLNKYGYPCSVDGFVGDETMWALKNPVGSAQESRLDDNLIPFGIGSVRSAILSIALAQHNIKEIPDGSNRGSRPDGGVDKFLPDWTKKPGQKGPSWCCFFVSYVVNQALGSYPLGKRYGSCRELWEDSRAHFITRTSILDVVPGDVFIMLHSGWTGHTGFVYNIDSIGQVFNTIEGNCGNRVKVGKRNSCDMQGFINLCNDHIVTFERKLVDSVDVSNLSSR